METIKRIIKKEKPDSILAGLGGQTGLTLAMQLDKEGFLEREGVRLLGTDAKAISRAEDRELFKEAMAEIGQPVIASDTVSYTHLTPVPPRCRPLRRTGCPQTPVRPVTPSILFS